LGIEEAPTECEDIDENIKWSEHRRLVYDFIELDFGEEDREGTCDESFMESIIKGFVFS